MAHEELAILCPPKIYLEQPPSFAINHLPKQGNELTPQCAESKITLTPSFEVSTKANATQYIRIMTAHYLNLPKDTDIRNMIADGASTADEGISVSEEGNKFQDEVLPQLVTSV
jgi:hypothetical protein